MDGDAVDVDKRDGRPRTTTVVDVSVVDVTAELTGACKAVLTARACVRTLCAGSECDVEMPGVCTACVASPASPGSCS